MIARREGVKAVQRQMRHKSAMTLDVYGHLYPEDHAEAVDRFDKQIRLASI
jgi:integrase